DAAYRKEVIDKELHGGLFGSGGFLGLGIGRDTEKIDRMIETAKDGDREKLKAEVGEDLKKSLSGDDAKLAGALLDGDKAKAEAVRIHQSDGIFTNDKEKAFAQMEGKSPEERKKMMAAFQDEYKTSATDFMKKEFGAGSNDAEAAKQLAEKGKMDPAFELKYAMDGAGTDMKRMKEALAGKSPEEIKKIKGDYQKLTGKTLEEDMAGETKLHSTSWIPGYDLIANGGKPADSREGLEVKQMLRGDPAKIADPADPAHVNIQNPNDDPPFD